MAIIGCLVFFLLIGFICARNVSTLEDYGVSRGHFSGLFITTTIIASFVGGGTVLGTMEKAATSHSFYPVYGLLGCVVQLILTGCLLAKRIVGKKNILTAGDLFSRAYGPLARRLVGILWVCFTLVIIAIQVKGMGQLLSAALGLKPSFGVILSGLGVTVYCFFGGVRAVVVTDFFQCVIMVVFLPVLASYLLLHLPPQALNIQGILLTNVFQGGNTAPKLLSVFLGFLVGDLLIPPVIQRILMCKTANQARATLLWGSVFSLVLIGASALIGLCIGVSHTSALFSTSLQAFVATLPPVVANFYYLGFFCVLISSADTYINAGCLTWAQDVARPHHAKSGKIGQAKFVTLLLGLGGIGVALYVESLFDFLLFVFKFWAPFVVVPLVGLLYGIKTTIKGLLGLFAVACLTPLAWHLLALEESTGISALAPAVAISCLLFALMCHRKSTGPKT